MRLKMEIGRVGVAAFFLLGLVAPGGPLSAQVSHNPAVSGTHSHNTGEVFDPPCNEARVNTPDELESKLRLDFMGCVIVPRNSSLNMTGRSGIPLRSGVSLIGERGPLGSWPLIYTTTPSIDNEGYNLFEITSNDVRVEGLHFRGPANGSRSSSQPRVHAIAVIEDGLQSGCRVVIANNEFNEWAGSAVNVRTPGYEADRPNQYDPNWPRRRPMDAGLVRVERNYIHNNARDGGGYGVVVGGGAYVTIEGNVFDFNRHAVSATGRAYSGYIARFNYVLQGGYRQDGKYVGSFYNQHFDVHGRGDDGYGGPAGEYFEIAFNTIRGDQEYYWVKTRPAFMLRGTPEIGAHFTGNVLVHGSGDAVSFKGVGMSSFLAMVRDGKYQASGNQFDTDPSMELATGDFDGDGRTDVFVANGTAWFFSRAGIRSWEFLHASNKRTQELGFADIDNDRVTDVLYRDPSGNVGYLKSGTFTLVPLTTAPVVMKDLRFGDFDGDSKTDIFYTRAGQWSIWYGGTRQWTTRQTSSLPISELLFGEFDGVRGTDVAGEHSGLWAILSAGTVPWAKLNNKLVGSFAGAVAADFDGNGKSDIAFNDGGKWRYSRDGVSPLVLLRDGKDDGLYRKVPLKALLVGAFDGGTRLKVVRFELKSGLFPGERLVIWRGLGSGNAFSKLSDQNLR